MSPPVWRALALTLALAASGLPGVARAQESSIQAMAEEATGLYRAALQTRDGDERGRLLFLVSRRLETIRAKFPRSTVAAQLGLGRYRDIDVALAEREGRLWSVSNAAAASALDEPPGPLVPVFGPALKVGPLVPNFGGPPAPAITSAPTLDVRPALRLSRPDMVERLRAATVMLYARTPGGYGWGTGFFISPTLLLTNTHVVLNHETMIVIGKQFGFRIAKVIYRGANDALVGIDTAVMEVQNYQSPSFLAFTSALTEGDSIAIAGFTGTAMNIDANADRMFETLGADKIPPREIIPALRFDFGVIQGIFPNRSSQVENIQTGLTSGGGNSGSPIVNDCAQVVGQHYAGNIAKFEVSRDPKTGQPVATGESTRFSYGLSSRELIRFLAKYNVPATISSQRCE